MHSTSVEKNLVSCKELGKYWLPVPKNVVRLIDCAYITDKETVETVLKHNKWKYTPPVFGNSCLESTDVLLKTLVLVCNHSQPVYSKHQ